ncbi:MAG: vitamin K epoxide reductase family protein [Parcubacteria group bacterium]|nr:vitamin K epoxide reductase family protein [Parcubacteria group bacterium]
MSNVTLVVILILSQFGFWLAFYIRHKKVSREQMVCYVGKDCDRVIHSEYSKLLGIPVEVLGMIYYGVITLSYAALAFFPRLVSGDFVWWVLSATTIAFLFSLYLIFIQAVVLKEWCEWCLTSAAICAVIFFTAIMHIPVHNG